MDDDPLLREVRRLRGELDDVTRALASIERCGQVHGDAERQRGR